MKRVVKDDKTGTISKAAVDVNMQRTLRKVGSSIGVVDALLQQVRLTCKLIATAVHCLISIFII